MLPYITIKDINQTKWPHLAKRLKKSQGRCYCLNEKLPDKKATLAKIYLLVQVQVPPVFEIEVYTLTDGIEKVRTLVLPQYAVENLIEILKPSDANIPKPAGRPRKYGVKDALAIQNLQREGTSIRQIAKILGMSTNTVQRLIKAYIK